MSGARPDRRDPEPTEPDLERPEPKELPFREGTMDALVREAEADPTPEEVVATTLEDRKRQRQGGDES